MRIKPSSTPLSAPGQALVIGEHDDSAVSDLRVLDAAGWRVTVVTDGNLGRRVARERRPDVVICDIDSAGVDDRDVSHLLVDANTPQAAPVVLVGGRDRHADLLAGVQAGAHDFLARPFSPDEFLVRCRAAARINRAVRRLSSSQRELSLLAEQSTDLVWRCGIDGAIRYASPSASAVLGWTVE